MMAGKQTREELEHRVKDLARECVRMREADQKFRSVFDGSMDGLMIVGSKSRRIICVNKRVRAILGYPDGELAGEIFDILLPLETKQPKECILEELQVCGGVFTQDFMHADGHICVLDLMATLVPWDEGWAILCTLRDVSERIRLEEQLRQAQKMEAIGALAGGVAHDLNNILAGLVSYPELLLMDLPEDSPLRKPMMTIKRSGERAAAIVKDLLTLARHGVSAVESVNLNQVISDYFVTPEYQKLKDHYPNIRVEKRLTEDLFPIVGSSVHLLKAIANLVLNAAEAMPEGGKVVVSTENHHINGSQMGYDFLETGDYAALIVSDSGKGIASKDLARIFEPFYTNKQMGRSGTGLGMTVVWGIVKDHHGHIDVKSEEGKGCTLSLYFPATREKPKKTSSPSSQTSGTTFSGAMKHTQKDEDP